MSKVVSLALFVFVLSPVVAQQYPNVAPTEALTPAEELKTFKLPPGFEVQLVASDPDIRKPIQIAFDAKGRLWATTSEEYPFAAVGRPGKDRLYVMEDFGADGKAKKVSIFADDLNIPIGVLPLPDCKSVIVSSIDPGDGKSKPECWIWKLTDTDGDGKADKKEKLYGPFGCDDTHGMVNSFTLMPDGWVYACHGFKNDSKPKGSDGKFIHMNSGNTFRFRPDGSSIQNWTYGQVNPFGITVDPYFNLYTADCHSKPLTQLIRGATYQSFGRPHDGLGFAPHITVHSHNSTALCGPVYYAADHFPKEYLDSIFLCNVTSNCINLDKLEFKGSTPVAIDKGQFLSSSDRWFRPSDLKLGPDGALYVADFYNRIIGHYEVDLKHPGRDKLRGRVWRIVYRGVDGKGEVAKTPGDFTAMPAEKLIELAQISNVATRLLAANELVHRGMSEAANRAIGMAINRNDPRAQRHALESLLESPSIKDIREATKELEGETSGDTHLLYARRVVLRESLRLAKDWDELTDNIPWTPAHVKVLADTALAVPSPAASAFLLRHLRELAVDIGRIPPIIEHAARYATDPKAVLKFIETHKPDDFKLSIVMLNAYQQGLLKRGSKDTTDVAALAQKICTQSLESGDAVSIQAGIDLASSLKLAAAFAPLAKLVAAKNLAEAQRAAALSALGVVDAPKAYPVFVSLLNDAGDHISIREKAGQALAGLNRDDANEVIVKAFVTAPARLQTALALALAGTNSGVESLLKAVETGKASARLLQDKAVQAKINDRKLPDGADRVAVLTKGLPSADERLLKLLTSRRDEFAKRQADPVLGKQVFVKNCAACHQIANEGNKIGPQLDGIGGRGLDRLLEDVLDPNRNVDAAFRTTIVTTTDGKNISGLALREEGEILVLADDKGKEIRIPKGDIENKRQSLLSPMPANVAEIIPEKEFHELVAYLLTQRAKDK